MLSCVAARVGPALRLSVASRSFASSSELKRTVFYDEHVAAGGKLVDFAGWEMPVLYADGGVLKEHKHCRSAAALFDVAHMCQFEVHGADRIAYMERVCVGDVQGIPDNKQLYSLLTLPHGGIIDDTVITKFSDHLYVVVNAGCADKDLPHLEKHAADMRANGKDVEIRLRPNHSLLALQGPQAHEVMARFTSLALPTISFFTSDAAAPIKLPGSGTSFNVILGRQGYTGEDGFELSIPNEHAVSFARELLAQPEVKWAGLGARDSLRLEAGLCLYGNDLTEDINPIQASLTWTIGKRRFADASFLGAEAIIKAKAEGVKARRIGLTIKGAPARQHAPVTYQGEAVGEVCSGTFSPTLGKAVAMAYLRKDLCKPGTKVEVEVRGRKQEAVVTRMPFVPTKYYSAP